MSKSFAANNLSDSTTLTDTIEAPNVSALFAVLKTNLSQCFLYTRQVNIQQLQPYNPVERHLQALVAQKK
jgi:hypothetical protein